MTANRLISYLTHEEKLHEIERMERIEREREVRVSQCKRMRESERQREVRVLA